MAALTEMARVITELMDLPRGTGTTIILIILDEEKGEGIVEEAIRNRE